MVRKLCLVLPLALLTGSPAAAEQWAQRLFETTTHDFGSVACNSRAEFRFVLKNIYLPDIHVATARPSCGCTSVEIENPLLKTYEKGAIVATLNTRAFRGQRSVTITVTIDRPYTARVQLHVRGYIRDDVVLEPGVVALGDVDEGTPVEKSVSVSRKGRRTWRILEVNSANPYLSAEVVDTTQARDRVSCQLLVRLDPNAPAGIIRDHLILVTNDPRSQRIPVLVEGRVVSGVTVSPATLFLGVVAPGDKVTRKLVVRGKQPFRVTSITSDGAHFRSESALGDVPKPVHVVPVTFLAGDEPGKVVETIHIQTDLNEVPPVLATFAVVEP